MAIHALAEGTSIRSVERMTGIHRDTIMRLGVKVGQACATLMDEKMRDLSLGSIEVDEVWGYIGKKQKNVTRQDSPELGDVWTYIALDVETKLIPSHIVGNFVKTHGAIRCTPAMAAGVMPSAVTVREFWWRWPND